MKNQIENEAHRGSTTLEMCFIMPIIIAIVFMISMLFLACMDDGIVQGTIYENMYKYCRNEEERIIKQNIENEIKSATVLDNEIDVSVKKSHGKLTVYADGKEYCMEIDKCTNRLRRWQIYGDIISD